MAGHCIAAASHAIDLLPNSFDPVNLYKHGPWFSQVSLIMQACAIIMLQMSFRESRPSVQELATKVEKLISWLREMAMHNTAAVGNQKS
jgi:hypothetical protein